MLYLVDGYNLLFRLAEGEGELETERNALIKFLTDKIDILNIEASIVFDGGSRDSHGSYSNVASTEVVYTGKGITADEYIIFRIAKYPKPYQKTVVTSDKKLARSVRLYGAKVLSIEEFLAWIVRTEKKTPKKKKKHLKIHPSLFEFWLKNFERKLHDQDFF